MNTQDIFSNSLQMIPTLSKHRDVVIGIQRVIKAINGIHRGVRDTKKIVDAGDPVSSIDLTFSVSGTDYYVDADNGEDFDDLGFSVNDKIWFSGDGVVNTGQFTIEEITDNAATNDRLVVTEVVVAESNKTGVLAGFTLLSGYSYNHLEGIIQYPNTVKETVEVFSDGNELVAVDYDDINNSQFTKTYSGLGRYKFVISSDIYGTDIEILAWFDLENITATSQQALIDVPLDYEDIIQDGVIYYLTSMPKYKDETVNAETKEGFFSKLQRLKQEQAVAFNTPQRQTKKPYGI